MGRLGRTERTSETQSEEGPHEQGRATPLLPPPPRATDEDTLPGLSLNELTDPYGLADLDVVDEGAHPTLLPEMDDITATTISTFTPANRNAVREEDEEPEPITERDPPVFS